MLSAAPFFWKFSGARFRGLCLFVAFIFVYARGCLISHRIFIIWPPLLYYHFFLHRWMILRRKNIYSIGFSASYTFYSLTHIISARPASRLFMLNVTFRVSKRVNFLNWTFRTSREMKWPEYFTFSHSNWISTSLDFIFYSLRFLHFWWLCFLLLTILRMVCSLSRV